MKPPTAFKNQFLHKECDRLIDLKFWITVKFWILLLSKKFTNAKAGFLFLTKQSLFFLTTPHKWLHMWWWSKKSCIGVTMPIYHPGLPAQWLPYANIAECDANLWKKLEITIFSLRGKLLEVRDYFCFVMSSRTGPSAQKRIEWNSVDLMKGGAKCPKVSKTLAVRVTWGLRPTLPVS